MHYFKFVVSLLSVLSLMSGRCQKGHIYCGWHLENEGTCEEYTPMVLANSALPEGIADRDELVDAIYANPSCPDKWDSDPYQVLFKCHEYGSIECLEYCKRGCLKKEAGDRCTGTFYN